MQYIENGIILPQKEWNSDLKFEINLFLSKYEQKILSQQTKELITGLLMEWILPSALKDNAVDYLNNLNFFVNLKYLSAKQFDK